ncbi:MAG TPA: hypothetical protein VK453_00185 [Micromonosporaceae bacterium]|nr:hypothetical protein [Micromonosporaceae bacterium]
MPGHSGTAARRHSGTAAGRHSGAAALRVGGRFQPLPGPTAGVAAGSGAGRAAIIAVTGTPVHAVEAGIVHASMGQPLSVRGDSGLTFEYDGVLPASVTVGDGQRVAAGAILGTVGGARNSTVDSLTLVLGITDGAGAEVDAVDFLVGATDPNELGHAAIGSGADVDPFALDEDIAADSPVGRVTP